MANVPQLHNDQDKQVYVRKEKKSTAKKPTASRSTASKKES
jgi:hypothetical protein